MLQTIVDGFITAFTAHPNILVFFGMIFAGETILVPAIYLAVLGHLSLPTVLLLSLLGTVISDTFWYFLGRHSQSKMSAMLLGTGKIRSALASLSRAYEAKASLFLYLSKFVYGTRIAAQILAGTHGMPFRKYQAVNILGVLSLSGFLVALAYSTDLTADKLGVLFHRFELAFLVFAALVVCGHLLIGSYLKKLWSRS